MKIDYSVVIRTMGKAGEKYQKLLDSISMLAPRPKEVIVVLPEGYDLPKEQLGWERFCYSKKGMVTQRLYGLQQCKTKYALVCDDDVYFGSDFVQKLYEPVKKGYARLSAGPLLSYLPKPGVQSFFRAVTGAEVPKLRKDKNYISILSTSGYSYYRKINTRKKEYLYADSLPWTCFFCEVKAVKEIHLEEEKWLEMHGYASLDDQTMFYKAKMKGIKTIVVTNAVYEHLDAKTSRRVLSDIAYAMEFNRYVFWHRFIYSEDNGLKKIIDIMAIHYYFFCKGFYNVFRLIIGKLDTKAFTAKKQAVKDAKNYTKSKEYQNLPPLKRKERR
ncbi:glycosyltransferase [Anaerostipes butyraticus]|uniref:Glycosyltransferase 2-like domain-containing protein n=1 Tax=Anaerostipes butyraticus TaxID=645466 RepID=A0A916VDV2_9FIRM|nr:hypothetical protein [Anaerostipes butyraticus]GFO86215.1 hypothetical protein ANBU17_25620 [Anaerostipes butyraticus]